MGPCDYYSAQPLDQPVFQEVIEIDPWLCAVTTMPPVPFKEDKSPEANSKIPPFQKFGLHTKPRIPGLTKFNTVKNFLLSN